MDEHKRQDFMKLCYIAHKRNLLEQRRVSAKNRIYHYSGVKADLKEYLDRHKNPTYEWYCDKPGQAANKKHRRIVAKPRHKHTLADLNRIILKARADYARVKYETAVLTKKTHKEVLRILKNYPNLNINYYCGYVSRITNTSTENGTDYDRSDIKNYHDQYAVELAVEKVLLK